VRVFNFQQNLLIIQLEKYAVIYHCATQFGFHMRTWLDNSVWLVRDKVV